MSRSDQPLPWSATFEIRFQQPSPPSLAESAPYYLAAEQARWYSNFGPCHELLTERLQDRLGGGAHCVLVSNCTAGLMVALRDSIGNRPKGSVILTPSYTFAATGAAIVWSGFEPAFIDVDPMTWQVRPDELRHALSRFEGEVVGALLTSTFGTPAPGAWRREWVSACEEYGVPLVIDSAAGFGAVDDGGTPLGCGGVPEVFSFHATKPFSVGEGGVVVCPDEESAHRIRSLTNFGFDRDQLISGAVGLNAKMSELTAAVGLAMLDRYDQALWERRELAARYERGLDGSHYSFQVGAESGTWQSVNLQAPDPATTAEFRSLAMASSIEFRALFSTPLHRHPAFSGYLQSGDLRSTERLAARALSLPMANDLPADAVDRVIEVLLDAESGASATEGRPVHQAEA